MKTEKVNSPIPRIYYISNQGLLESRDGVHAPVAEDAELDVVKPAGQGPGV